MRLITRDGKYHAVCYYTDPATGRERRKVKSTRVHNDGSATARATARTKGLQYEAALNGAQGHTRAKQVRRASPATITSALLARIAAIRAAGRSEASVEITGRHSPHILRYFGPNTDLDEHPITSEALTRYAHKALIKRKPPTVYRECVEIRAALKAYNSTQPEDMHLIVPKMPELGQVSTPVEIWLTPEQSAAVLAHLEPRWRDHFIVHRTMGLSRGEITRITVADLLGAGAQVRVRGTKRATRDRVLAVSKAAREILLRRALERRSGPLFEPWPNSSYWLNKAADKAGITPQGYRPDARQNRRRNPHGTERMNADGSPHYGSGSRLWTVSINVLRASFCTELVLAGVHAKKIAELMGHKNTRMVDQWYARLRGEDLSAEMDLIQDPRRSTSTSAIGAGGVQEQK